MNASRTFNTNSKNAMCGWYDMHRFSGTVDFNTVNTKYGKTEFLSETLKIDTNQIKHWIIYISFPVPYI